MLRSWRRVSLRNPYEDLFDKVDEGDEVGGAFTCQERDCWSTVTTARYLSRVKILTWICENDHISKIEGFEL